jgi:hypothetical protein
LICIKLAPIRFDYGRRMEKAKSDDKNAPNDILLWRDGYWCYRKEFCPFTKPNFQYEVIPEKSVSWQTFVAGRPFT